MKFLLVVLIFAVVTYLAIRWMQEHGPEGTGRPGGPGRTGGPQLPRLPGRPKPPTKPVAPDDDEAFLRELEWKRRQQERNKRSDPPPDQPAT